MSTPGDYYARKDAERKQAFARLQAVKAELAEAESNPFATPRLLERLRVAVRKADAAYDLAAYVGD